MFWLNEYFDVGIVNGMQNAAQWKNGQAIINFVQWPWGMELIQNLSIVRRISTNIFPHALSNFESDAQWRSIEL